MNTTKILVGIIMLVSLVGSIPVGSAETLNAAGQIHEILYQNVGMTVDIGVPSAIEEGFFINVTQIMSGTATIGIGKDCAFATFDTPEGYALSYPVYVDGVRVPVISLRFTGINTNGSVNLLVTQTSINYTDMSNNQTLLYMLSTYGLGPMPVCSVVTPVIPDETPVVPVVTETPVVNGTETPVVNGTETPVVNGTETPVVSGTETPVVNGTETPVVNGTETPVVNGTETPVVNGTETPVVNGTETPVVNGTGNKSDKDEKKPEKDEKKPEKDEKKPEKDEKKPEKDEKKSCKDCNKPGKDDNKPGKDDRKK
jgi:hypothetical protein